MKANSLNTKNKTYNVKLTTRLQDALDALDIDATVSKENGKILMKGSPEVIAATAELYLRTVCPCCVEEAIERGEWSGRVAFEVCEHGQSHLINILDLSIAQADAMADTFEGFLADPKEVVEPSPAVVELAKRFPVGTRVRATQPLRVPAEGGTGVVKALTEQFVVVEGVAADGQALRAECSPEALEIVTPAPLPS